MVVPGALFCLTTRTQLPSLMCVGCANHALEIGPTAPLAILEFLATDSDGQPFEY